MQLVHVLPDGLTSIVCLLTTKVCLQTGVKTTEKAAAEATLSGPSESENSMGLTK